MQSASACLLGNVVKLKQLKKYFGSNYFNCFSQQKNVAYTVFARAKSMLNYLPFYACGEIVPGFGRGSSELGIPTANYPLEVVKSLPSALQTGVYYGWANVNGGEVHKMVMSIGWNPFYDNKEKSMETHVLHDFNCDLYGQTLRICIVGYIRPEQNFDSLDELVAAIQDDIAQAKLLLDNNPVHIQLKDSHFFQESITNTNANSKSSLTNGSKVHRNGS